MNILKILKSVILVPLATLFNTSLSTGIVPSKFEVANVIPLHKKDSHTDLCNYRPIPLLSTFNKLLEKIVSGRLLKFLEKEKMLFKVSLASVVNIQLTLPLLVLLTKFNRQLIKVIYHVVFSFLVRHLTL